MDLRKGMEKLQAFQLLDKDRYGLLLMTAAFWRRASRVEIQSDARHFQMTWECQPLSLEEMQSLFRLDGQLVPMGLALINALALKPDWIRLDSGAHRLEIRRNQTRLLPLAPAREGVRFHLRERLRWRVLGRLGAVLANETRLIAEHCIGTGRVILINGESLEARVNMGSCQELWLIQGPAGDRPEVEPTAPVRTETAELPYQAVVAVGESLRDSRLVVIAQGQRFRLDEPRIDPILNVRLFLPEHPTDLARTSLVENQELVDTLVDLESRIDRGLLRLARDNKASDALMMGIVERLSRRRMLADWVEMLGLLLTHQCRNNPEALDETLRRATTPRPEKAAPLDSPGFQESLAQALQRLRERRGRFLTVNELNQLVDSVACLHLLRPTDRLAREVADEAVLLLVAAGGLKTAATLLDQFGLRDERLGLLLLCLGHDQLAEPLLPAPFHQGLLAFYRGEFEKAARLFESVSEPGMVLLDYWARSLAGLGQWDQAQELVQRSLETCTGLDRTARLAFARALENQRLDYPFEPAGFGLDERFPDLRDRGLALSSPSDQQAAEACLALLREGESGYARLWETGTLRLGAAHPMFRALGRALADRYLQAGQPQKCLTVGLIPELLALWPRG